jgi:hypothetical protein
VRAAASAKAAASQGKAVTPCLPKIGATLRAQPGALFQQLSFEKTCAGKPFAHGFSF